MKNDQIYLLYTNIDRFLLCITVIIIIISIWYIDDIVVSI